MADREITCSGKDSDGDIISIGNAGAYWSPRKKADAINDIESGEHSYYIQSASGRVDISVVGGPTGKYLRSSPNSTGVDNLDNLQNC